MKRKKCSKSAKSKSRSIPEAIRHSTSYSISRVQCLCSIEFTAQGSPFFCEETCKGAIQQAIAHALFVCGCSEHDLKEMRTNALCKILLVLDLLPIHLEAQGNLPQDGHEEIWIANPSCPLSSTIISSLRPFPTRTFFRTNSPEIKKMYEQKEIHTAPCQVSRQAAHSKHRSVIGSLRIPSQPPKSTQAVKAGPHRKVADPFRYPQTIARTL